MFLKEKYIYIGQTSILIYKTGTEKNSHTLKKPQKQNTISLFPAILVNDELHVIELF